MNSTRKSTRRTIQNKTQSRAEPSENGVSNHDFENDLVTSVSGFFEDVLHQVFEEKRHYIVHAIAKRMHEAGLSQGPERPSENGDGWIEIESLSRLRSVVGGRFQNLKKKWVSAGFPLREHRGDKEQSYTLNEDGWIEISNWILKQGYEARLTPNKTTSLFELRSCKLD